MTESLVLIESENIDLDEWRSRTESLPGAKGKVIGSVDEGRVVLHVAANSVSDLGKVFLVFSQVPGVSEVMPLTITNQG